MSSALAFEDVRVRISGKDVLAGVSLALGKGRIHALLGPSGAGKTTLLRVALGLVAPDTGVVSLNGERASAHGRILIPPEVRGLGVVFQDLALWPHLTVRGNLAFGLRAGGVPPDDAHARIDAILRRVGLSDHAARYPAELSGGERQRVAIARALVTEPVAILLDEPLANVDVVLKRELLALFHELIQEQAATALYVTHDPREAERFSSHWAVLEAGRISQQGDLADLCQRPATPFIRALIGEMQSKS